MFSNFITPTKTYSNIFEPNGVYYGVVKRIDETINKVWVEIPRITPNFQHGPLSVVGESLPAVGANVACIFAEGDTENIIVMGQFLALDDVTDSTWVTTLTTTTATAIRSIDAGLYRSAKFIVQVSQGNNYLLTEILAIHNGTTVSYTEYGRVVVGTAPAIFDVELSSGNMILKASSTSASATVYKIKTTAIAP
jgi:hypothetical protein